MKLIMRNDPFVYRPAFSSSFGRDLSRLFDFGFPGFDDIYREFTGDHFGAVDVYKDGTKLVLRAELPGVPREDISVDVADGQLVLAVLSGTENAAQENSGQTKVSTDNPAGGPSQEEKPEGTAVAKPTEATAASASACKCEARYTRTFTLPPDVDPQKISARYENGVLTVELPQREEAKPRTVNVQVS